ncbi:hypothetical protein [Adlercreutzia muris]|uniref:hypothetical protein n=1 Tax=Adlercreutzia muris TaxID=1796610 RepID=UPI001F5783F0|nr:hypothetical protein [Adlercreutzia muris]
MIGIFAPARASKSSAMPASRGLHKATIDENISSYACEGRRMSSFDNITFHRRSAVSIAYSGANAGSMASSLGFNVAAVNGDGRRGSVSLTSCTDAGTEASSCIELLV